MNLHLQAATKNMESVLTMLGAFAHSFTPSFYSESLPKALVNLWKSDKQYVLDMIRDTINPKTAEYYKESTNLDDDILYLLIDKIIETNTVGSLESPVDVWVDAQGQYTVDVPEVTEPVRDDLSLDLGLEEELGDWDLTAPKQ